MAFFDDRLISCTRYDGYSCEKTDMAVTPAMESTARCESARLLFPEMRVRARRQTGGDYERRREREERACAIALTSRRAFDVGILYHDVGKYLCRVQRFEQRTAAHEFVRRKPAARVLQ